MSATGYLSGFLALALALAVPDLSAHAPPRRVSVVDLRAEPLDTNSRSVGISRLAHGYVDGIVVPIPSFAAVIAPKSTLLSAFFEFKNFLATTPKLDVKGCGARPGRIATWLSAEAPESLAPSEIGLWVARGVRIFSLAGEGPGAAAAPASTARGGLSPLERAIVENALKAGARVDVSGLSEPAFEEVVNMAQRAGMPLLASHSNAQALADDPANLSDAELRSVAETGGVIGITFDGRRLIRGQTPELRHVVRQVLHAVEIAGIEHVAIGSGFGQSVPLPRDLESAADFPRLAAALEDAKLAPGDIAKIFHANARRVLCAQPPAP